MFSVGFEKIASKKEHDSKGATKDALIGLIPFGTTAQTALGDRPKGHSRLGEWGTRVGGSIVGSLPGAAVHRAGAHRFSKSVIDSAFRHPSSIAPHGKPKGIKTMLAGRALQLGGMVAGERMAAKHVREHSKEKY